jgi:hypothetical protein
MEDRCMNKGISAVFLVLGVILLFFGFNAYHSTSSGVSRFFTGAPTDKALWLLIAGAISGVIGILGLVGK